MKVSIGKAAEELGVNRATLRRWEKSGKIQSERTANGHRRYNLQKLKGLIPSKQSQNKINLCYARVSSHDQKEDLKRQEEMLATFCSCHGWSFETISDLGSGLNYQKRGLQKLLKRILSGEIGRLVLTHKDRLLRFGAELIFSICEEKEIEVIIINKGEQPSFEEELSSDVLEIITVFSAKLYGSRSHKNKKLIENLKKAVGSVSG